MRFETDNSAAMREALENAYSLLCEGIATEVDDELEHPFHLELAREVIKSALSIPARNCDRFADETDAQIAFLNDVWLISVDRETMLERDQYENWSDEMRTRYGRWLLAPAAERKGERDA